MKNINNAVNYREDIKTQNLSKSISKSNQIDTNRKRARNEYVESSVHTKNKRIKVEENFEVEKPPAVQINDTTVNKEIIFKKAIKQAQEFERELQKLRLNRINFAKDSLK